MNYVSESGHWYTRSGAPAYTYQNDAGEEKKTTLRQARTQNLVPSVTTVIGIADKPGLQHWKALETIRAAQLIQRSHFDDDASHIKSVMWESKRVGKEAADRGTELHAEIERGFKGGPKVAAYCSVMSVLNEIFPDETWLAEEAFCSSLGYGGKIDLCSVAGVFVDFKTKDNLAEKTVNSLVYDEHGMQLSAYAQGKNFLNPERLSIFIDRKDPSIVKHYLWPTESHGRHIAMFKHLLSFWQLKNNYHTNVNTLENTDEH